ncbi:MULTISPECIES: lipase family protein [Gordonia]|uniref:lipase family protein n=1 Tax=Gordonia TaxID=2053 RepID=UPI0039C888BA
MLVRAVVVALVLSLSLLGYSGYSAGSASAAPPSTGQAVSSAAAPTVTPANDPFYTPSEPIGGLRPGAVISSRVVTLGTNGTSLPATGTQLLYRTNDAFGAPSSTVTTIISPPGSRPGTPRRMISYHEFYDALGSQCDPSYTLRGGKSSSSAVDVTTIASMVSAGYTVVVPDYEGPNMRWTIGKESAHAALDGIRAAQRFLRAPASTPVGLYGYSGGSIPTGFGAELAPSYAPELNLVGATAGGVLVNPANNLAYVNGTTRWSAVIPALMSVYDETYGIGIEKYLSPKGVQVLGDIRGECINNFLGKYPNLTDSSLLLPQYPSLLDVPGIPAAIKANVMGSLGTPRTPMMLGVGDKDGRGDGVMLTADVVGLSRSYCARGLSTSIHVYKGLDHAEALAPWTGDAFAYLNDRFAGRPAPRC